MDLVLKMFDSGLSIWDQTLIFIFESTIFILDFHFTPNFKTFYSRGILQKLNSCFQKVRTIISLDFHTVLLVTIIN